MRYNKRQFKKITEKKILHKVKKQWIVLSASLLALLGCGVTLSHLSHASVNRVQGDTLRQPLGDSRSSSVESQADVLHTRILQSALLKPQSNSKSVNSQPKHTVQAVHNGLQSKSKLIKSAITVDFVNHNGNILDSPEITEQGIKGTDVNVTPLINEKLRSDYLLKGYRRVNHGQISTKLISDQPASAYGNGSDSAYPGINADVSNDGQTLTVFGNFAQYEGTGLDQSDNQDSDDSDDLSQVQTLNLGNAVNLRNAKNLFTNLTNLKHVNVVGDFDVSHAANLNQILGNDRINQSAVINRLKQQCGNLPPGQINPNVPNNSDGDLIDVPVTDQQVVYQAEWGSANVTIDGRSDDIIVNGGGQIGMTTDLRKMNKINQANPNSIFTDLYAPGISQNGCVTSLPNRNRDWVVTIKNAVAPSDSSNLFANVGIGASFAAQLREVNVSGLHGRIKNSYQMFSNDWDLLDVCGLGNLDLVSDVNLVGMFDGDPCLTTQLNGSRTSFDISDLQMPTHVNNADTAYMFDNDPSLIGLSLSDWDTSHITDMSDMFANDTALQYLGLGDRFNTQNVVDERDMLQNDRQLNELNLGRQANQFCTNIDFPAKAWYLNGSHSTDSVDFNDGESHPAGDWTTNREDVVPYTATLVFYDFYSGQKLRTRKVPMSDENIWYSKMGAKDVNGNEELTSDINGHQYRLAINGADNEPAGTNDYLPNLAVPKNADNMPDHDATYWIPIVPSDVKEYGYFGSAKYYLYDNGEADIHNGIIRHQDVDKMRYRGDLTHLKLVNVRPQTSDLSDLFVYNDHLQSIDLGSDFDTSNVRNMNMMFGDDYALKTLNLGPLFNTAKLKSMNEMFHYDFSLNRVYLPRVAHLTTAPNQYGAPYFDHNISSDGNASAQWIHNGVQPSGWYFADREYPIYFSWRGQVIKNGDGSQKSYGILALPSHLNSDMNYHGGQTVAEQFKRIKPYLRIFNEDQILPDRYQKYQLVNNALVINVGLRLPIHLIYEYPDRTVAHDTKDLSSRYYNDSNYFYPSQLNLPNGYHLDMSNDRTQNRYQLTGSGWLNGQIPQIYIKVNHNPKSEEGSFSVCYWNQQGQLVGSVNHIHGMAGQKIDLTSVLKSSGKSIPQGYTLLPGQNHVYQLRNQNEIINLMVLGNQVSLPLTIKTVNNDSDHHSHVNRSIRMIQGRIGDFINISPNQYQPAGYVPANAQGQKLRINSDQTLSTPQITYYYHRLGKIYVNYVNLNGNQIDNRVIDGNGLYQNNDWIEIGNLGMPSGYRAINPDQKIQFDSDVQHVIVPVCNDKLMSEQVKVNQVKLDSDGKSVGVVTHLVQLQGNEGQSMVISPYDEVPNGYHVTDRDHDVQVILNSKSRLKQVNFTYAPNYNSVIGEIRVHYINSDDMVPGRNGRIYINNQIDEEDDHGLYGKKFNLVPYENDVPNDNNHQYHFESVIGVQPSVFTKKIQDVYLKVD